MGVPPKTVPQKLDPLASQVAGIFNDNAELKGRAASELTQYRAFLGEALSLIYGSDDPQAMDGTTKVEASIASKTEAYNKLSWVTSYSAKSQTSKELEALNKKLGELNKRIGELSAMQEQLMVDLARAIVKAYGPDGALKKAQQLDQLSKKQAAQMGGGQDPAATPAGLLAVAIRYAVVEQKTRHATAVPG